LPEVKQYVLINRHARDQWLRAAQSIPLNIAEGNGKQSLKDKNRFFKIACGSALECASIHDVLRACNTIDPESDCHCKLNLKRIVSMLTRLIQRTQSVSEGSIQYENTKPLLWPVLADTLTMNFSRFGHDEWLPEHNSTLHKNRIPRNRLNANVRPPRPFGSLRWLPSTSGRAAGLAFNTGH